ncbi:MAG TPA: hypothetical protein VKZ64_00805 [Arenimonas sp.]|jgi:hypothetical protein|nr:hypothetical protein [Arenimonas sp.]
MSLRFHLHRALIALPLLVLALAAAAVTEPPAVGEQIQRRLGAGLAGHCDDPEPGLLRLARVPGHIGVAVRRAHCAG